MLCQAVASHEIKTPWDDIAKPTDTQEFLQMHYVRWYDERHSKLADTGEAKMLNSYAPAICPFWLKMLLNAHNGFSRDDLQRYLNQYSLVMNKPKDHLEKVEKSSKWFLKIPNCYDTGSNLAETYDF